MADLTFLDDDSTLAFIDKAVEMKNRKKKKRGYLGMSEVGDKCQRKLWLKFHVGEPEKSIEAKLIRIFAIGDYIEKSVIKDLKTAGIAVDGRQRAFKDHKGKFQGHCDGIVTGLKESDKPHILEIKSANDKNFGLFKKDGVKNHPTYGDKYFAQAQLYMGYAGLDRCLFIIENKNTGERHMERLKFVHAMFEDLRGKAHAIITALSPPRGIHENPSWWECKFCQYNSDDWCRKTYKGEMLF